VETVFKKASEAVTRRHKAAERAIEPLVLERQLLYPP
jgi:hypothetical protein